MTYWKSKAKIKDLSNTSNLVQGEGLLPWTIIDCDGKLLMLEVPGFHIPKADVHLLSPQVLLVINGGQLTQTSIQVTMSLDDGSKFHAIYNPSNNLPHLKLALTSKATFWNQTFAMDTINKTDTTCSLNNMVETNTYRSASQKEVLLWYHRLSCVSIKTIQLLMADQKWLLADVNGEAPLHDRPIFKSTKSRGSTCSIKGLLCATCQLAKQHGNTTGPPKQAHDTKQQTGIKRHHLQPGA